ncbi:unnamed protein product [Soboliphyme baturini]|uniref:ABC transmembrane type-1 domain-containing protein n=1 Tax=Soboliphyme baturini TaxID=241478 RepID=A0A183J0F8_9BILA|nr:unnamed protein product [Soboliphyme baturini]
MALRSCAFHTIFRKKAGRHNVATFDDRDILRKASFGTVVESLLSFTREAFLSLHESTHLPWWALITVVTVTTKAVSFPLMAMSQKNSLKCLVLAPYVEKYSGQIKSKIDEEAFRYRWSERRKRRIYAYNMGRVFRDVYEKQGCHPYRSHAIVVFQLPVWFSYSVTIRDLSLFRGIAETAGTLTGADQVGMKCEGLYWFTDLTTPDPYYIIPVLIGLSNYAIFKVKLEVRVVL